MVFHIFSNGDTGIPVGLNEVVCIIGYRSYITIIEELSGNERSECPLNFFIIVIYDL